MGGPLREPGQPAGGCGALLHGPPEQRLPATIRVPAGRLSPPKGLWKCVHLQARTAKQSLDYFDYSKAAYTWMPMRVL